MVFTELGIGTPVSGLILTANAKSLHKKLYGRSDSSVNDISDTSYSENSKGACLRPVPDGWQSLSRCVHLAAYSDDIEPSRSY